jgi:hypothetical protein
VKQRQLPPLVNCRGCGTTTRSWKGRLAECRRCAKARRDAPRDPGLEARAVERAAALSPAAAPDYDATADPFAGIEVQ